MVWTDPEGRHVVEAKTWEPEGGKIDITDVMAHIRDLSFRYDVQGVAYDPRFFDVPASMLEDEGVPMVEVPQSHARMVPACGFAYEQIVAGNVRHNGDPTLTAHVLAAARRTSEGGWTLSKGKSRSVIDGCIAFVLALWESQQRTEAAPEPFAIYV
jgi:phage terminase large subunit-like protein